MAVTTRDDHKTYLNKMQENLNRLAAGFVVDSHGSVSIEPVRLELTVRSSESVSGAIVVSSPDNDVITGTVISHNLRMTVLNPDFSGSRNEIGYTFDASGMEPGEVIKGEMALVMDAGEFVVPYVVSVLHGDIESDNGPVRNLFHFTNLAQDDFDKAAGIFYSDAFAGLMESGERDSLGLYRGFSGGAKSTANFELFLCSIKKKNPVYFRVRGKEQKDGGFCFDADESSEEEILISMDGWGYCDFTVIPDADYLEPVKDTLSAADFKDRTAAFKVRINADKLHAGLNYGRLRFVSPIFEFEAVFCVRKKKEIAGETVRFRHLQAYRAELIKSYIAYCIKNITRDEFEKKVVAITKKLNELEPQETLSALFRAHALWVSGDTKRALEVLPSPDRCTGSVEQGYRYYISYLLTEDEEEKRECCRRVSRLYMESPDSDKLLWFMLEMDDAMKDDARGCVNMIRHHFNGYGAGPLLYLKSYEIFSKYPELFEKMDSFEIQVFGFAIKTGLFERQFINRALEAASGLQNFEPLLYRLLQRLYEEFDTNEVLSAVCMQLIKAQRTDEEAFEWYSLGVDKNLGITRLIEYYILSLPYDHARELPKIVQYYFRYEAQLPARVRAALYSHIIRYSRGAHSLKGDYRPQMLDFALQQAQAGQISPDLAVLYRYLHSEPELEKILREKADVFAFSHFIASPGKKPEYIVVVEEAFIREKKVKAKDGAATVPIYSNNYEIFLEMADGTRFLGEDITDEILMNPADWEGSLAAKDPVTDGISVYFSEKLSHAAQLSEDIYPYVLTITKSERIRKIYKRPYMLKLLRYLGDDVRGGVPDIDEVDMSALDGAGRAELLELLVHRGEQERALKVIERYGIGNVSPRLLMRLLSMSSKAREMVEDPFVLWLAFECFKQGKYDDQVMRYLVLYLRDTTKTLRSLWRCAMNFDIDTRELEERMLIQMMYTGAFVGEREDIFDSYVRHTAGAEVEMAWITCNAYDHVVRDCIMDERFFKRLLKVQKEGRKLNDFCALSLIMFFAEDDGRNRSGPLFDDGARRTVAEYINEFLDKKIILKAFMAYRDLVPQLSVYEGSIFVEYKCAPESVVILNYAVISDKKPEPEYRRQTMKSQIPGIYSARFVLFYGERLEYYMSEEGGSHTSITESEIVEWRKPEYFDRGKSSDVMNEMLSEYESGNMESLSRLMEVYSLRKTVGEALFKPF